VILSRVLSKKRRPSAPPREICSAISITNFKVRARAPMTPGALLEKLDLTYRSKSFPASYRRHVGMNSARALPKRP